MIRIQPTQNFFGFGNGGRAGEYVYSEGMRRTPHGIMPGWLLKSAIDNGTLTDLTLPYWFAEGKPATTLYLAAIDGSGNIFLKDNSNPTNAFALAYKPDASNNGNG